jgi:hypothetical protein
MGREIESGQGVGWQFLKNFQYRQINCIRIQSYDRELCAYILKYNTRVVKMYSTTSSLVRFQNKNILFYFDKRSTRLVLQLEIQEPILRSQVTTPAL